MNESTKSMIIEGLKIQMEPSVTELWTLMSSAIKQLEESGIEFGEAVNIVFECMVAGVMKLAEEVDFETLIEGV